VKHTLLSLLLIITVSGIYAQETQLVYASSLTSSGKSYFRLGDRVLTIAKHGTDTEPFVFVSLHNNETTSIDVTRKFIKASGGLFIELQNNQQRMVLVDLYNRTVAFDPNRIFTSGGIEFLKPVAKKDDRISKQVAEFAHFILNEIPSNKVIVSVHNNTDDEYSIRSYVKHPAFKKDAKMVHVNPDMDEDDFFMTTSKEIFEKLQEKNYNVVLQSSKAFDDGSLSVYCGNLNRAYVNVECEMGHEAEQMKMLETLAEILK
jgi:hypothetical protein